MIKLKQDIQETSLNGSGNLTPSPAIFALLSSTQGLVIKFKIQATLSRLSSSKSYEINSIAQIPGSNYN